MSESRTKNVSRNIKYGLMYKAVTLLLPFITRTLLLYLLGTSSVGISSLFSSLLSFLNLAELGINSAIVYSMYKPIAENDTKLLQALLGYFKKIYRIIGIVILLLGIALTPFLQYLINGETPEGVNIYILYYIYLMNSCISYLLFGYKQSLLIGYQRSDIRDKIAMITTVGIRLLEIAVITITRNLYAYASVAILGTLVINISTAVVTDRMYPEIQCAGQLADEHKREIRKKLGGLFGTKLNAIVVQQADNVVISSFLGLTILAQYGNYYYIFSAVSGIIMVFFSSMTASIGNKLISDSESEVFVLYKNISFINSWIVGWCSICLLCLLQPFVTIWVGESNVLSFSIVILLSVYLYIYQIQRTILTFKDAAGLWHEDRYRPYVSMTINLISNIILVLFIGLEGVIISSIIAFFISIPWCNSIIYKHIFHKNPFQGIARMLVFLLETILIGSATYALCTFFPDGIIGLLAKAFICLTVPNLLYFILLRGNPEFGYLMQTAKNLAGRKL